MNTVPTPSTTITLSKTQKIAHMHVIQRVVALYDEAMSATGEYGFTDLRDDGVNQYGTFRTATGIILVVEGGRPTKLWTPWGSWHFAWNGFFEPTRNYSKFLDRLALLERTPPWPSMARKVTLYDLLAVDGEEVPSDPVLVIGHPSDEEARALKQEWKELYSSC